MKVVFHVDELEKWTGAKGNILNLLKLKEGEIVLLVNGPAVSGIFIPEIRNFVEQTQGIQVHFCQNALNTQHISKEELPEKIKVVPAGVLDLIELQEKGFAYIKP